MLEFGECLELSFTVKKLIPMEIVNIQTKIFVLTGELQIVDTSSYDTQFEKIAINRIVTSA